MNNPFDIPDEFLSFLVSKGNIDNGTNYLIEEMRNEFGDSLILEFILLDFLEINETLLALGLMLDEYSDFLPPEKYLRYCELLEQGRKQDND